ncbi:hypothetical protein F4774DRAFT_399139 [Daldinia eschscholtzii]|nr:hypothetical protein F4774DRAFT_399139 [Daldinia eschscholtzii]
MAHNRYLGTYLLFQAFFFSGLSPARVLSPYMYPLAVFPWSTYLTHLHLSPLPHVTPCRTCFFPHHLTSISGININNLSIAQPLKRSSRIAKHHSLTTFAYAQTYIHCFNPFHLHLSNLIFLLNFIIVALSYTPTRLKFRTWR